MLSGLSVRVTPDHRLRRLVSLPTSMNSTSPLETEASPGLLSSHEDPDGPGGADSSASPLRPRCFLSTRSHSHDDRLPKEALARRDKVRGLLPTTPWDPPSPPGEEAERRFRSAAPSIVRPPTPPLRPVMTANTSLFRITATAGTKFVEAYFFGGIIISSNVRLDGSPQRHRLVYDPKAFLFCSPTHQAGSSFRPLSKIPHCCPRGRGSFQLRCGGTLSQARWRSSIWGAATRPQLPNPRENRPSAVQPFSSAPFQGWNAAPARRFIRY